MKKKERFVINELKKNDGSMKRTAIEFDLGVWFDLSISQASNFINKMIAKDLIVENNNIISIK